MSKQQMNCNADLLIKDLLEEPPNPKVTAIARRAEKGTYSKKPKAFLMAHLQAAKLNVILENCKKGKYDVS